LTLLGRYDEAILLFDKVIDQSPKYILARKGFLELIINFYLMINQHFFLGKGEAHFYLAIQHIGRYKDQLAVVHIQQSLTVNIIIVNIHDYQ